MATGAATDRAARQTGSVTGHRWMARGAFAGIVAAVLVLVASEGPIGLTLLVVGPLGTVVVLVDGSWFIANHGMLRWFGLALAVLAVVLVVVIFLRAGVVTVALVSLLLLLLGGTAARAVHPGIVDADQRPGSHDASVHRDEPQLRRRQGRPLRPGRQGQGVGRRSRCP